MKFVTKYEGKKKSAIVFDPKEGKTKSNFKDECDINKIVAKYNKTGQLPDLVKSNPAYGDFSDVPSYQEALQRVHMAQAAFEALPALVRQECGNDPAVFLERVKERDWAIKHKLALPPQAVPAEPAMGVQEAPNKGAAGGQPGGDGSSHGVKKSGKSD